MSNVNTKFDYQVWSRAGTFVKNLNLRDIMNDVSISEQINGGQGNLSIEIDGDPENPPVTPGQLIYVRAFGDDFPSDGTILYKGSVEVVESNIEATRRYLTLEVYGLFYFLQKVFYRKAGVRVFNTNEDPKTTIEDMITYINTLHPFFDTDATLYGSSISTDHDYSYIMDILEDFAERTGYYFYCDVSGMITFAPHPVSATWTIDYGKNVKTIHQKKDITDGANVVFVDYNGGISAGATDATSVSTYGTREVRKSDTTIGDVGSANDADDRILAAIKDPVKYTTVELRFLPEFVNIRPGDTITIRGVNLGIDNLQVHKKTYNIDSITLELEKIETAVSLLIN